MNDTESLRARLAGLSGSELLGALDEAADGDAFRRLLRGEYPALAARPPAGGRRRFLSLVAASMALGGLSGCGKSKNEVDDRSRIVPYVRQPTDVIASAAMVYSSAVTLDGLANGAWVTCRNGRPIKIEGNPDHPWSRGGTDIFGQASVLGLYDPDRSQAVRQLDRISDWPTFQTAMAGRMSALRARRGAGLRLLTPPISAPSLLAQIAAMRAALPEMRWHTHAPAGRDAVYDGAARAFGRPLETRLRFDAARVVVAIDGDFLDNGPHQAGVARDWIEARRASVRDGRLLALHAAGPTPGLTSARADFPAVVRAAEIGRLLDSLAAAVDGADPADDAPAAGWVRGAARALREARGAGIVTVGAWQPAEIHAAAHRLNATLGNIGRTVFHTQPALSFGAPLEPLVADMRGGHVDTLLMLDANPVYAAPGGLRFAEAMRGVGFLVHAGSHVDETAIRSDWHLPLKHPLESWGDPRAPDGTVTLMQPTIEPLYGGRSVAEIVSMLQDQAPRDGLALLRGHWKFADAQWQELLLRGFIPGSAFAPERATLTAATPGAAARGADGAEPGGLRVLVRPDPTVWDGAVADNGWLQELPKPLTKVTWENVIAISPDLAARERLSPGDVVTVEVAGGAVQGPVWVLPGQADDAISLTLGYGRSAGSAVATGLGYDAFALLPAEGGCELAGATLRRTGALRGLAVTQELDAARGDDFVRVQTLGAKPVGDAAALTEATFYNRVPNDGRSWGMAIDLDACIGCNACVIACQAENNIAVVGRDQVELGRILHWLRIDRYYAGAATETAPRTQFMPVPCMHCENAPCELGCPVEATLHDHEGLNLQVYNRCIGTRACSSYCPYKVRHFNYLDYTADLPPSLQARENPDVTVRARGVMEKCTYCVQRIVSARIDSDKSNAPIADGTVQTACQQACPTRAFSFGDMQQADSAVAAAKREGRNYALLGELNTRPHTTYLARYAPAGQGTAS